MKGASGRGNAWLYLLFPALVFMLVFFAVPLVTMVITSFREPKAVEAMSRYTINNYRRFFGDRFFITVLLRTMQMGLVSTIACIIIGYPLAYRLAKATPRWKTVMLIMVLTPLLTDTVIRCYGWIVLLADHGLINTMMVHLGVFESYKKLMYNMGGTVVVLTHVFTPIMVLSLTGVIESIDPSLEQASRSLGASRFRTFMRVTLPLSLPGILAGSLLVFSMSVSSYAIPQLIGGYGSLVLPVMIYQLVVDLLNWPAASAYAVILLANSILIVYLYYRLSTRALAGFKG